MSLPPFGARSGRSRIPSRRRRPPFRAALEPRPPVPRAGESRARAACASIRGHGASGPPQRRYRESG
eukprot:6438893-Prymnesium_polylepis.1